MLTLVVGIILFAILIRQDILHKQELKEIKDNYELNLEAERKQAIKQSKAVIKGQVMEHMLPMFKDFPYKFVECRFSGQPIDYVVFENIDQIRQGSTEAKVNIILADVKTNASGLTNVQRAIKKAVEAGRVKFEVWSFEHDKLHIV